MDFDEYEYLEKTVEKPNNKNGLQDIPPSEEKDDDDKKKKKKTSRHTSVDNDDDSNHHRSKRARSNDDDVRDRDRRRDKDKERHRRSSRDRDRDREERNGRDRDREREKERERRREREREREMELELERKRRSRSRSERRHTEREEREKSRDRDIRERDARSYKEKKEEAEPEADPERDQRTVFAYQIALKADERDVYDFFSRAGKVRDVRLIMDRNSRRSKGVGYIEFYDAMSVPMAIALSGQPLLNQPVMVKPSEAEKNLVQSTTAIVGPGGSIGPYSGGARRLYVGNLHINITEEQLRQVFEPFGQVELVQLPLDPVTGLCKGFGFVQYARLEDARAAQNLNGQLDIAGRTIKVSAVSDQVGMQEIGVNAADFDDEEGGGMYLNAGSRAMLMQKLDRSGITSTLPNPVVNVPGLPPVVPPSSFLPPVPSVNISGFDSIGVPSECLLLKNMFDPKAETEPDFELDIRDDVQDECSKFGQVKHIYVDKYSAGCVYLRFDSTQSAMNAQRALHGRWFAGKLIEATYMVPLNYEAKFPESR